VTACSVIICTFNRYPLVKRAIDSVLSQKNVDFELIVVDDCSTDNTFAALHSEYENKIKLVKTPQNSKVAYSTNFGFSYSSGDHIALLGDDDYWNDNLKLYKQLQLFDKSKNIAIVGSYWVELGNTRQELVKPIQLSSNNYIRVDQLLSSGSFICGSTALLSREAWIKVGGMDVCQRKGTDSDLFRRIVLSGFSINTLPEPTSTIDISHTFKRMTPIHSNISSFLVAQTNLYLIKKHWLLFCIHPAALFVRLRRVIAALVRGLS